MVRLPTLDSSTVSTPPPLIVDQDLFLTPYTICPPNIHREPPQEWTRSPGPSPTGFRTGNRFRRSWLSSRDNVYRQVSATPSPHVAARLDTRCMNRYYIRDAHGDGFCWCPRVSYLAQTGRLGTPGGCPLCREKKRSWYRTSADLDSEGRGVRKKNLSE